MRSQTYGKMTTRYQGRPPGNLPRLMSHDEFANKKLMDCVNAHVSATRRMVRGPDVNTDPKFELCDTVRASRALLRCCDPGYGPNGGAPTSTTTNVRAHASLGQAPRRDPDGGWPGGGKPRWSLSCRRSNATGRCKKAMAGTLFGGGEMAARQRPFRAGCKGRALRDHGVQWDGVTQIVKYFN